MSLLIVKAFESFFADAMDEERIEHVSIGAEPCLLDEDVRVVGWHQEMLDPVVANAWLIHDGEFESPAVFTGKIFRLDVGLLCDFVQ